MAKAGFASLSLLVLATFAQCVLGQSNGYTYVHNSASFDIAHRKHATHADGSDTIVTDSILTQGTTEKFEIPLDVICVRTWYVRLPARNFDQSVLDWCQHGMPVDCLPDCYWIIDDTGFSVANSESATLQFVAAWLPLEELL